LRIKVIPTKAQQKHQSRYTRSMYRPPQKHCRTCGTSVIHRLPDDGDTRKRAVCPACGLVHYDNPLNVVGTVPVWGESGEQVLLCMRNIEPRRGKWTLPAGYMEMGETTSEGAARETFEEAGAEFEIQELFTVINVARVGQVHFFYRAQLLSAQFDPGHETMEARLFTEDEIPWDELAFKTVGDTLKHYFEDRRKGIFGIHAVNID
jgi:ADP-ribose pyrophosphatase YjhB (NUDIX family)